MAKKKSLSSLSDEELKSLYNYNVSNEYTNFEIANEVSKRINERTPIVRTSDKLDAIKGIAKGFSFDRLCYRTPYSCMVGGKRVWFGSLDGMYYSLTRDDSWYKQDHKHYQESEWWLGKSHPTSYTQWLSDNGIKLQKD